MSSQTNYYPQQQAPNDERRRYCKIHPYAECVFLCTDPSSTDCPFKCDLCFFEQNLTPKYLIPIKQIQRSDTNTILWNWPLPDEDSLLQQVKAVTSQPRSDTDLRDKFGTYFKELRLKINQKIDELEEATNKQAEQLWDFNAHIASEYNRLSAKETLRECVTDVQTDPEKLSIRVRETIASVLSSSELTKQTLERELEEHSLQVNSIDFEGPNRIMEDVLAQLGKISPFLVDNVSDMARQYNENDNLGNGNASVLYALATNSLNRVSEEFKSQLKKNFLRMKKIYDKADFGEVFEEGEERLELELLEEQEIGLLRRIAEQLLSKKKNPDQPQAEERTKVWTSEVVLQLISNSANRCPPNVLNQLQQILLNLSSYFSAFQIAEQLPPAIDFTGLTANQLNAIDDLAKKMTQLTQSDADFPQALSPIPRLQPNSIDTIQSLKKEVIFSNNQADELNRLLASLPILELLSFNFEKGQLLNISFTKTSYQKSNELEIKPADHGSSIFLSNNANAQAVSECVLQNDLMYEVTCTFNKPLCGCDRINIGLIEDSLKNTTEVGYGQLNFNSRSDLGARTAIRGVTLNSSPLNTTLTQIKLRFCIESQQMFMFDESRSNIVKGDATSLKPDGSYRFGVSIMSPSDGGNWGVTVSIIRAFRDRSEIDKF